METCEDCGCPIYRYRCVKCNEEAYDPVNYINWENEIKNG